MDGVPYPAGHHALTYYSLVTPGLATVLCINLHIALKWLVMPHSLHILLYAGHCLRGYPVLQYLEFSISFCRLCLTLSCFLFILYDRVKLLWSASLFALSGVVYCKKDTKANIWYNVLEQKVTVFSAIYFPASSYPVFCFCFCAK